MCLSLMNDIQPTNWTPDSICLHKPNATAQTVAPSVYNKVCRKSFDAPGFCLLNVGSELDSHQFRQLMVDLKSEMSALHSSATDRTLHYLSAVRFDQQTTTKLHLDGGPEECFLMLGYEPSDVDSEVEMSDYSKCAFDNNMSPKDFMEQHNPMFGAGYNMLKPYTIRIPCFSANDYQIICINNSSAPYMPHGQAWQGVLHTATILAPDDSKRRVINSTMIASVPKGGVEPISDAEQQEFVSTSIVRRRGYDKTHLEDDT